MALQAQAAFAHYGATFNFEETLRNASFEWRPILDHPGVKPYGSSLKGAGSLRAVLSQLCACLLLWPLAVSTTLALRLRLFHSGANIV